MLGLAVALAASVHEHQTDKGGNAYILHPLRLMMRLRTKDEELMCIAVLHDTIEDSEEKVTIETLRDLGFSERVLSALTLLTHDHKIPYDVYIKGIAVNEDAIRIKIEDLKDNSDITRLKGLRQKDFERLEKYHRAYLFLQTTLETMRKVGYSNA